MAWRLRPGVSLHPMPFGGAFVLDAARQISFELTQLLTGTGVGAGTCIGTGAGIGAGTGAAATDPPPPALAAELRLGLDDGWLIHQDRRQAAEGPEERNA